MRNLLGCAIFFMNIFFFFKMLIILLGNDLRCHRICPRVLGMVKNCISGFLKRGAVGCGEVRGGAQFISTPLVRYFPISH